ncbi:WG repeat-containing protein [Pedobacter duraquae]|uniref:WG repeat protein n=1 Tax=Pedobacter duraquae TaxID=425511 RepID=A0A4R6IM96_9SPHI|nr:WG repeat-containing protein [Pedobacter duraquae]TDO23272.1 WG repeat protein [Pedobacter duraquae]
MKLINKLLSLTSISLLFACSGHTEVRYRSTDSIKNVFAEQLKNKTLPEARTFLNTQTEQLDQLLEMMNTRIQLSISSEVKNPTGDEGVIKTPIHALFPAETVEQGMKVVARNYDFTQQIEPKGSTLFAVLGDRYPIPEFYGNNEKNKIVLSWSLSLDKLFFHDQTTANQKVILTDGDEAMISAKKPLDSAYALLKYSYATKTEELVLDKDNPIRKTPFGTVALKEFGSDAATVQITGKTDNVLTILGMDTKGRYIDQNSNSSYSLPSEAKQKILEIYNKALKSWVKNIDNKKYKNTGELIADIRKTMPAEMGSEELQKENIRVASLKFYQNIAKLVVVYATEDKTVEEHVTLKNTAVMESGNSIAEGDKKGIYGIVAADGAWVIPPSYANLQSLSAAYFKSCITGSGENACTYYRFDPVQKKLLNLNTTTLKGYVIEGAVGSKFVQFSKPAASGLDKKGIADNNGNIVLQPIYDEIGIAGNFLITVQPKADDEEFGVYTLDGKAFIPPSTHVISQDSGYIFVHVKEVDDTQQYRLLEQQTGKDVLPAGTFALEPSFKSDLLLVGNASQKYYIDSRRNKKFDVSAYQTIARFYYGYAKVTNSAGLRGLINSSGKLVVPCIYEDMNAVNHGITMVTKVVNNAYQVGLLDVKTGKFIVPLVISANNYSTLGSDESVIYTINDKRYDYRGKLTSNN